MKSKIYFLVGASLLAAAGYYFWPVNEQVPAPSDSALTATERAEMTAPGSFAEVKGEAEAAVTFSPATPNDRAEAEGGPENGVADMFNEPSTWQQQFAAEATDPVWSVERQLQIDATLRKLTQNRSDVLVNGVECKSRLCAVNLTMTTGDQGFMASAIAELSAAEWNRDGAVELDQMKQTAQGMEVVLFVRRQEETAGHDLSGS